jgi:predicted protein tyrosine phosphatase
MWNWTLNWSEVRFDLIVGSCPREVEDVARIRDETRASALLCVQSDECLAHFGIDYAAHRRHGECLGLAMMRVPMRDFDVEDQRSQLPAAVAALCQLLSRGHRVYVHCTAGLSRSPLVLVGYLTLCETMSMAEAFALVKQRRPGAVPSPEALTGCRSDLIRTHRSRIEARAWLNYCERLASRRPGDTVSDWLEAERSILRSVIAPSRA